MFDAIGNIYMTTVNDLRLWFIMYFEKLVACVLQTCSNHLLFGRRRFDWVIVDNIDCDQHSMTTTLLIGALLSANRFILLESGTKQSELFRHLHQKSPQACLKYVV